MNIFWLMWLAAGVFALAICWDAGVRQQHRVIVVKILIALFVLFNLYTQTEFFRSDRGMGVGSGEAWAGQKTAEQVRLTLSKIALAQGWLRNQPPGQLYRTLTSSLLHYGWMPLIFNLWIIWLLGRGLETLLGWKKFLPIVLAGLIIPAAAEGFAPPPSNSSFGVFRGGASGLVYCLAGAALVCFPRVRCRVAVNLDLSFWGIALGILLPVTMATRHAGLPLTEMILITGMVLAYLVLQPENPEVRVPLAIIIAYKLLQDLLLMGPLTQHVLHNSPWRILVGGAVGVLAGFMLYGIKGFKTIYVVTKAPGPPRKLDKKESRRAQAQRESEAAGDEELARRLLAQKVFLADSDSLGKFYADVVMPNFPAMVLPARDQATLARMLKYKGLESAALHAYENLLQSHPLHDDDSAILVTTAELIMRCEASRSNDARRYLDQFLALDHVMLRDKIEAQRMLAEIGGAPKDEPEGEQTRRIDEPGNLAPAPDTPGPSNNPVPPPASSSAAIDFPRLPPRSFRITEDGFSELKPTRNAARGEGKPGGDDARAAEPVKLDQETVMNAFWKPLPVESRSKLDGEALLALRTHTANRDPSQALSGNYAAAGSAEAKPPVPAGRAAQLETRRQSAGAAPARKSYSVPATLPRQRTASDAKPALESKLPRPYGSADISFRETEPVIIRLKGEKNTPDGATKKLPRRGRRKSADGDNNPLPDRIAPVTDIPATDSYT